MAITDKKISETYANRDVASLGDRPNEDGLTASQLKARFDQLPKEVIPQYNALIDELNDTVLPGKSDVGHTHDDRYFTETEVGVLLSGKSDTSHTHDGRYYTETETDALLSGKSNTAHNHDWTYAPIVHNHDDIYYTDDEVDTLLLSKSDTTHTHDDRYYTETETNTLLNAKADKLYATNMVTNGDFSNGTTGWSAGNSTLSASGNVLSVAGNGVSGNPYAYQDTIPSVANKKIYMRSIVRITTTSCDAIRFNAKGSTAGTSTVVATQATPVQNTWYTLSGILTTPADFVGSVQLRIIHDYANAETANGKVMEVKYVQAIDLTTLFGAGKEPTKTEIETMLSTFTNSWFNGTAELVTIANLAQLKADKTQEAWITPTLLNGWVNRLAERPLRYRKDGFGIVHLSGQVKSGTITSVIASLPAGYRPNIDSVFATATYSAAGSTASAEITIYVANGNIEVSRGSTIWVSLDGVTFSTT